MNTRLHPGRKGGLAIVLLMALGHAQRILAQDALAPEAPSASLPADARSLGHDLLPTGEDAWHLHRAREENPAAALLPYVLEQSLAEVPPAKEDTPDSKIHELQLELGRWYSETIEPDAQDQRLLDRASSNHPAAQVLPFVLYDAVEDETRRQMDEIRRGAVDPPASPPPETEPAPLTDRDLTDADRDILGELSTPAPPPPLTDRDLTQTDREILDELGPPPLTDQDLTRTDREILDALPDADLSNAFGDSDTPPDVWSGPAAAPSAQNVPDYDALSAAAAQQYQAEQNAQAGQFYQPASGIQQPQLWQNYQQSMQHSQWMHNQQLQNMNQMMQPQMQWGQRPPPRGAPPPTAGPKPPSTTPSPPGGYREFEVMGGYNIDGTPIQPIHIQVPNVGP
jgi:hypothetical protein